MQKNKQKLHKYKAPKLTRIGSIIDNTKTNLLGTANDGGTGQNPKRRPRASV